MPFLLIINCLYIYTFRKWLGPFGIFIFSITNQFLIVLTSLLFLYVQLLNSTYWFIDLGRFFLINDLIDTHLVFIIDPLSLILISLVTSLTVFAQYFGVEYMYREAYIIRLIYLLNFFSTSVIFLFLVFDFFLVLIVWELIGLFSLLLVNFYSTRLFTLKAAFKTFIFSRISDFFIFIAFFIIIVTFNTTDFSLLFLQIPFFIFYNIYIGIFGLNLLNFIAFLISISGAVKAAQFLFHVWLPDAMEAPTPASALIHSSTLVIMGIYLIVRFSILFEFANMTNYLMAVLGALTIALGAVSASFQNDIKKLVAYSTVSQMGYLFCGCGFLCYSEVIFYLAIHAMNKAFLFILVGYIVHFFFGNTDLRFMGSLFYYSMDISFIMLFVSLNLTGLPLTSGFFAKEFLIFQTLHNDYLSLLIRFLWHTSLVFTPFYMLLLNLSVFFKIKSNAPKLNKNVTQNTLVFNRTVFNNQRHNLSYLISKLTSWILLLAFFLINTSSESILFMVFDAIATDTTELKVTWLQHNILVINSPLSLNISVLGLLSIKITLLTMLSMRWLFKR